MLLFLTYSSLFFLLPLSCTPSPATAKPTIPTNLKSNNYTHGWRRFEKLVHAKRGSHICGISLLKSYFHRFGYLSGQQDRNYSEEFDSDLELAVIRYQEKHGLEVSGTLDPKTISAIMSPRCGISDSVKSGLHTTERYVYFPGHPRWFRQIPMTLTYAFSAENLIPYMSLEDISSAFRRAFSKWESVIPVRFEETGDYGSADIRIGFYGGEHGDGQPFDGVLGVLAHAFSPPSGKFHLDADERWAVDFEREKSKVAVDLESVALHEIGHVLGLAHSTVREAVMYPSLKPREKKLDLTLDDVEGVQALYGSNPNFTVESLQEYSETSNSYHPAVDLRHRSTKWAMFLAVPILYFFM
ncbi:hypothetical protein Nepgr_002463 [Nepenthes gracilis]|uniref:Peptidase metallopeptidase domain-containing protein n=1 Tax=Nepenthes gracilis TaxID=150966 RepID=A0AAD3P9P1_NEPGR|nr:hypothetical protein Nepgr_002463 [Nepenthes gracilis]